MKNFISSGFVVAIVGGAMLATGCASASDGVDESIESNSSDLSSSKAITTAAVAKGQVALDRAQLSYANLKSHPPLRGTWSGTGSFSRATRTSLFSWFMDGGYITHGENFFSLHIDHAGFTGGGERHTGNWPAGAVNASATDILSVKGTVDSWDVYAREGTKSFRGIDTATTLTADLQQVTNPLAYEVAVAVLSPSLSLSIGGPGGEQNSAIEAAHVGGVATIQQDINDDFLEPSFYDHWGDFSRVPDANGCFKSYKVRVSWSVPDDDVSATTVAGATLLTPITTVCH